MLFKLINYNANIVGSAHTLIKHVSGLGLSNDVLKHFMQTPIKSKISGFHIASFQLWKLADLVAETWVDNDVLNVMAELSHFKAAAVSKVSAPLFLYMPTEFFADAEHLYKQSLDCIYSLELLGICH